MPPSESAALGFVPVVGEIVDVAWLVYDVAIGDWEAAAIDLACLAVPCAGAGAVKLGAKLTKSALRTGDNARDIARTVDNLGDASRSLDNVGDLGKSAGKIDDSITVRHYTNLENMKQIKKTGHLNENTWVTRPSRQLDEMNPREVEKTLGIKPGKGEWYVDFEVRADDLIRRPNLEGGFPQYQLKYNTPIDISTFIPNYWF